ncbi:uncharacterized protein LOC141582170 [Saimiri boliviensis]|uniref:uncharacterized protein LOC141582170 n=1 Tax=Saimiri boliviensis TaxID=27679 RepID=UPI003D787A89
MRSGTPSLKTDGERETGFRRTRPHKEVTRGHRSSGGGAESVSLGLAVAFLERGALSVRLPPPPRPGRLAALRASADARGSRGARSAAAGAKRVRARTQRPLFKLSRSE